MHLGYARASTQNQNPELQPLVKRIRIPTDLPFALTLLLVLACAAYQMAPYIQIVIHDWNVPQRPSWVGVSANDPRRGTQPIADIDTRLIHGGLTAAPRFRDTLRWWHSTWAGQVPFYRPLSSLVFWGEWKLFGDWEVRYTPLAMVLHLLVIIQFTVLAYQFFRRFAWPRPGLAGLLSGLLFVDGLWALPNRIPTLVLIFFRWKNIPDSLCALFFCLALICYLRYQAQQISQSSDHTEAVPPSDSKRRFRRFVLTAAPPLAYLASCLCKESGIVAPLLLILLEWEFLMQGGRARQQAIRRMTPTWLVLPLFLIVRTLSLHTATGFRYGSNGSWKNRLMEDMFGIIGRNLAFMHWPPLFMAIPLFVLLLLIPWAMRPATERLRRRRRLLVLLSTALIPLLGAFFVIDTVEMPWRPVVLLLQFGGEGRLPEALGILLFLVGSVNTFRFRLQAGLFCYAWVLSSLLLLTFSPYALHRNYLMEGGFALLIGGGLCLWTSK